jgi:hypothetical protein
LPEVGDHVELFRKDGFTLDSGQVTGRRYRERLSSDGEQSWELEIDLSWEGTSRT